MDSDLHCSCPQEDRPRATEPPAKVAKALVQEPAKEVSLFSVTLTAFDWPINIPMCTINVICQSLVLMCH